MSHNNLIVITLLAALVGCSGARYAPYSPLDAPVDAAVAIGSEIWAEGSRPPDQWERRGINYYEPQVLWSNEDAISIKYLTVNSNAMHGEVLQIIDDHCDGSYIETSRQEIEGWTTVDAECTRKSDS